MTDRDLELLRQAIALSRSAAARGNHPFGALLADAEGAVLLTAENTVVTENDVTGHAETNLVRLAARTYPDLRAWTRRRSRTAASGERPADGITSPGGPSRTASVECGR